MSKFKEEPKWVNDYNTTPLKKPKPLKKMVIKSAYDLSKNRIVKPKTT